MKLEQAIVEAANQQHSAVHERTQDPLVFFVKYLKP